MKTVSNPAEKKLNMVSLNTKELIIGLALVASSFLMPVFFNVQNFGVHRSFFTALHMNDKTELMKAAILLVTLNSLRGMPHYIGAFFISESVDIPSLNRHKNIANAGMTLLILLLTYWGIDKIHHIHYDFGMPAVMVLSFVILFGLLDYRYISLKKKAALVALVLTAFQFLDIMPIMRRFPVGRGETSWDMKQAALLLDCEALLNMVGAVGIALFLLFGGVVFFQLRDENYLRELNALKEQNQEIRMQAYETELRNRANQEVQYLVHDLKSPLTAIQTMAGVLKMEREQNGESEHDIEYLGRIETAVEQMSRMISEILYENQQSSVTTSTITDIVLAQISVTSYKQYVRLKNDVPDERIMANRILFPRVLVNLLQNSAQAIPEGREPKIELCVMKSGSNICFSVSDNGKGIPKEDRETVWNKGFSRQESSGLGLAFVCSVVERMCGKIELESGRMAGTKISIILPKEETDAEGYCDSID